MSRHIPRQSSSRPRVGDQLVVTFFISLQFFFWGIFPFETWFKQQERVLAAGPRKASKHGEGPPKLQFCRGNHDQPHHILEPKSHTHKSSYIIIIHLFICNTAIPYTHIYIYTYWLVVWNICYFSIYWEYTIIPTDFNSIIFQRGRVETTIPWADPKIPSLPRQVRLSLRGPEVRRLRRFGAWKLNDDHIRK